MATRKKPAKPIVRYVSSSAGEDGFTGEHPKNVPPGTGPFKTIQFGVDALAALKGTTKTLVVLAGEYRENVEMIGKKYSDITVGGQPTGSYDPEIAEQFCEVRPLVNGQQKGSVFHILGASDLTLSNLSIQFGKAAFGAGVRVSDSSVDIIDCCIQNNVASSAGGGFLFDRCRSSSVQNCRILANEATASLSVRRGGGGGRITRSKRVTIQDSVFLGNAAVRSFGGGLYIDNRSELISVGGCDFGVSGQNPPSPNVAGFGGAIATAFSDDIKILGNHIESNEANLTGGGIYALETDELFIFENTVDANSAADSGGGIAVDGGSPVSVIGNEIQENQALRADGGGVALLDCLFVQFEENVIALNSAFTNGGGVSAENCDEINSTRDRVLDNQANAAGGGIYANCTDTNMHQATVTGNQAGGAGGGVFTLPTSDLLLGNVGILLMDSNCQVKRNNAAAEGGGVCSFCAGRIRQSVFSQNSAGASGGGLWFENEEIVVETCTIRKNTAKADGGGIYCHHERGEAQIKNSTIAGNDAVQYGGGLVCDGTKVRVEANEIANNTANTGGGASIRNAVKGPVSKNRFSGNGAPNAAGLVADGCNVNPGCLAIEDNVFSKSSGGDDILLDQCQPKLKPADVQTDNTPPGAKPPTVEIN